VGKGTTGLIGMFSRITETARQFTVQFLVEEFAGAGLASPF
jgi:hypothetical protein